MPVVTLRQESLEQGHFYVPQFEIKIAGASLPRNVLRDVTQVTYKDGIREIDSFELTVNNWDSVTRDFKYVGAETTDSLKSNPLHRLFDPCNQEVEVWLGYAGHLRLMMTGAFTTAEPTFPSSGAPTLTIRGLNVLHQLRRKQYTSTWSQKRISEIAKNIETLMDPGPPPKKRFPLPIVTDGNAKEDAIPYVAQMNQFDIDFLLSQARQHGYVVFVLEGNPHGTGVERERRLYFGPSQTDMPGLRDVTFALKWGISLVDFKPTLTTANQIKSVTVNGWNRATKQPINATVTLDDPKLNINRDLHEMIQTCDPREELVVNEPVYTPAQARERAVAILLDRHKEMVKASATCIGLPDLRAGQRVNIEGLGARFSGTYFVTETTHTIGDGGYTTKFNARREDKGNGGSA